MRIALEKLKKALVKLDIITEEEFEKLNKQARKTKRSIEKILVEKNFINEEELTRLIADSIKIPFIRLRDLNIPQEVLNLIPERIARERKVIIFRKEDNAVDVAMADTSDLETISLIRKKTNLKVNPYLASEKDIRKAFVLYKRGIREEFAEIIEENIKKAKRLGKDISKAAADLPIVKIVNTLIEYAAAEEASDIHIEPLADEVLIRFRIDGLLRDVLSFPRYVHAPIIARIKVLADLKIDEHRKPQDGRFKVVYDSETLSIRTSIMPTFYGEKAALRLLFETAKEFSLSELGLAGTNLETVKKAIKKPYGMLLATGPTGCGKTTTLYTILNMLNREEVNICTIEDPIEYSIERVNQTQVDPKIGLDFANGLRSLVRQDPDIIMVGEIRDLETAQISTHSAMTGHLVLSTLHTNDAAGALLRLIDIGIEPYLIASTVNIIIAQRLVRRICKGCIESYSVDKKDVAFLKDNFDLKRTLAVMKKEEVISNESIEGLRFYRGKGCNQCNGTGYRGRIGIFEVLDVADNIRKLIISQADSKVIKKQAEENGMITMLQDGFRKALSGESTLDEVLRVTRI